MYLLALFHGESFINLVWSYITVMEPCFVIILCFRRVFSLKMDKKCVNGNRKYTHALLNLSESKSFQNATFGEAAFPVMVGASLRRTRVKSFFVTLENTWPNSFYHPQTKLREGNVFTGICLSFCLGAEAGR